VVHDIPHLLSSCAFANNSLLLPARTELIGFLVIDKIEVEVEVNL
jgi:hypothetical protein